MVYAWNDTFHASVVVSKKVARLAVARNKIRRRIYDIVRNYKSHTNGQGVYIFVAKAPVVKNSFDVLKQEVHTSMDSVIKK